MRILYFGTYRLEHARNRILIDGLRKNGATVLEIQDRSRNFMLKAARLLWKGWTNRGKYDFMVVGFPGFTVMPLARVISTAPIVFDAFLSNYDSNVFDRQIYAPGSFRARYYFFLDWLACRLADLVLLDTQEHIKYFTATFGLPSDKFRRIWIGAHDQIFTPQKYLSSRSGKFKILFWGWIIPLHGVEFILRAAKILQNENIEFQFIGGGAEKQKMVKLGEELQLTNVVFLRGVSPEQLLPYIHEADICLGIFGKTQKAKRVIPNKLYEALASQKAVITAETPAAQEALTDKEHVLFCRSADGGDLADKILELKNNPALRKHLEENGYKLYLNKFSPKILGQELLQVLGGYK